MEVDFDFDLDLDLVDLGSVLVETKQTSPVPPFYADSTFGFGKTPNGFDDEGPIFSWKLFTP